MLFVILSLLIGIGSGFGAFYLRKIFHYEYETGYLVVIVLATVGEMLLIVSGICW